MRRIAGLFGIADREVPEDLGNVVGTMLGRVVLMQVAIIFGAMFARGYGTSMAPLLILIGLKTLSDLSGSSPLHGATVTVNDTRYEVK